MDERGRIVVHGERTVGAAAALRWAVEEAQRYDGTVLVVQPFDTERRADLALEHDLPRARRDARYRAQAWVVDVVADTGSGVPVRVSTPDGTVDRCLLAAAEEGDVLVLSDADPGLVRAMTLGACCPVVVVSTHGDVLADAG
jgi:hypothetical protein